MTEYELEDNKQKSDSTTISNLLDNRSPAMANLMLKKKYLKRLERFNEKQQWKWRKISDKILIGSLVGFLLFPLVWAHSIENPLLNSMTNTIGAGGFLLSVITLITAYFVSTSDFIGSIYSFNSRLYKKMFKPSKLLVKQQTASGEYKEFIKPYIQELNTQSKQLEFLLYYHQLRTTLPKHKLEQYDDLLGGFEKCLKHGHIDIAFSYIPLIYSTMKKWEAEPEEKSKEEDVPSLSYFEQLKNSTGYNRPKPNLGNLL